MGFWDTFKQQPDPEPVEVTRANVVGVPRPEPEAAPKRALYKVVGVWGYDPVTHSRTDEVDATATGNVELDGGRRASVGDEVELTRQEAVQVAKVFALSMVL